MSTKLKALLLPFASDQPVRVVEIRPGNLEDIYDQVAPDSRLFTCLDGKDFSLYGDDEAFFHPEASLRVNAKAMQLLADSEGVGIDAFASPLIGDFLVFGLPDDEGRTTDVPQRAVDFNYTWATIQPKAGT